MIAFAKRIKACSFHWLEEHRNPLILLLANAVIISISYSLFLRTHFSVDAYAHMLMDEKSIFIAHMEGGRWFAGAVVYVLEKLGISRVWNQAFGFFALAACMAVSAVLIVSRISRVLKRTSAKDLLVINSIVLITFVNTFTAEYFIYIEAAAPLGIGILLAISAMYILTKNWSVISAIASSVLIFLSCSLYEVFIGTFIVYALCILLIQNDFRFSKTALLRTLMVFGVVLVGGMARIVFTSILARWLDVTLNYRGVGFHPAVIIENVRKVFMYQRQELLQNANRLLPERMLIYYIAVISVIGIASLIIRKLKKQDDRKPIDIAYVSVTLFGCYVALFLTHFISPVFWPAPRTMAPLFAWLSLIALAVVLQNTRSFFKMLITAVCIAFLCVNVFIIQQIAADQLVVNTLDKHFAKTVLRHIQTYEEENGISVTHVSVRHDAHPTYAYYADLRYVSFDINIRAGVVPWCINGLLYYVSDRVFESAPMDEGVYALYFEGKNWNAFEPEEQMYFVGDTLYLMLY